MKNINQLMMSLLNEKKYDDYLNLDNYFYSKHIKTIENANHYEKMYRQIEPSGINYGNILKTALTIDSDIDKSKICFFLPSLDSDLAHVELLSSIIENNQSYNFTIYVAGFTNSSDFIHSSLLKKLHDKGFIKIIKLKYCHSDILNFLNDFNQLKIAQLIVTSIPMLIVPLIRVLGKKRVTWLSMKFELDCFSELTNRISFCSHQISKKISNNIEWHRIPPKITGNKIEWRSTNSKNRTIKKLITINREEKIYNSLFLKSIEQILINNPNVHFYWTGRVQDERIDNYFKSKKMDNQVHYIGWVNADEIISDYDIFLDTPDLSGSVAAKVFAEGMPVATFENSQSWIDFYSSPFNEELIGLGEPKGITALRCKNLEMYCSHVNELIKNEAYYLYISSLQLYLAKKYYFDNHTMSYACFKTLFKITKNI